MRPVPHLEGRAYRGAGVRPELLGRPSLSTWRSRSGSPGPAWWSSLRPKILRPLTTRMSALNPPGHVRIQPRNWMDRQRPFRGKIVRRLRTELSGLVKYEECARVLASIRDAPGLTLVGWLVADQPLRVWWCSDSPSDLRHATENIFVGTGAERMRGIYEGKDRVSTNLTGARAATLHAVMVFGALRFQEMLFPRDWDKSFGFAYEALFFDGHQFVWGPGITYVGWTVRVDEHGCALTVERAPVVLTQRSEGDYLLIQGKSALEPHWHNSVSVSVDEIPLSAPTLTALEHLFSRRAFVPLADSYVNYFIFLQADRWWLVPCAVDRSDSDGIMWAESDGSEVRFLVNHQRLTTIFRDVANVGMPSSVQASSFHQSGPRPVFRVVIRGTSGATEPDWSKAPNIGDRVTDGSVVWERVAHSNVPFPTDGPVKLESCSVDDGAVVASKRGPPR